MKHIVCKLSLLMLCLSLFSMTADALPSKVKTGKKVRAKAELERCRRSQGSAELSLNNVRARINQGGNMWYDGSTAQYYVPKDGNSTAMFCAALWIGGQDENQQLRVAALRFGSEGDDFWPGPLTVDGNASVNKSVCDEWDKLYRITRAEVEAFVSSFETDAEGKPIAGTYDPSTLTEAIKTWPGNGNTSLNQSKFLAPFYDQNGDGIYTPEDGDYPYYDFSGDLCPAKIKANLPAGSKYTPTPTMESDTTNPNYGTGGKIAAYGGLLVDQVLKGDETLWWIFNDKGNAHTESGSENPIGLEIRAQAFAFTMNNEINNMTFYSYEIINRSTFTLTNTYFSQWVDCDLGYAQDDFVGCDVERGLGYCYNGTATDGPGTGAYSGNPPAVGIDFFQGPYIDPDGLDNPKVQQDVLRDVYGESVLDQYRDSTGVVNDILLTDDAEKYKVAWYPSVGAEKDPNGACAINGVNFGNGIVDDERFGMRRFVYYNNDGNANNGEPSKASDYYNYLRGIWKDGTRMRFGGNGYNSGNGLRKDITADFMFPGTSDIWGWGTATGGHEDVGKSTEWSETTAGNSPADRRFMQSAGPFTLKPGAINYITVGIPFAQATTGGPLASVELLRSVDDKCQALFDNCFNILEGPDAPDVVVQELDREIILYLTNETGNNKNESFRALDESIPREYSEYSTKDTTIDGRTYYSYSDTTTYEYDRYYKFEGYQIFQLKDATVSVADIYDNDKARLVAQCDIENYDSNQNNQAIGTLVNYTNNESGQLAPQTMVEGANAGIQHTFRITEDKFATTTDKRIVNNKKYYYIAIAYAYNNYKPYSTEDATKYDGQKEPYLASRKKGDGSSIEAVVAIPHMTQSEQYGTLVQASYGVSPEIMRIEGNGNGGMTLNLTSESINSLVGPANTEVLDINGAPVNIIKNPVYQTNYGPLNVRIVDPLNVKPGNFYISIIPGESGSTNFDDCYWMLTSATPGTPLYYEINGTDTIAVDTVKSARPIGEINEQIIFDLGISISISNVKSIANTISLNADMANVNNQVISGAYMTSDIEYEDDMQSWLLGFSDNDGYADYNWIRSGSSLPSGTDDAGTDTLSDYYFTDATQSTLPKLGVDPNAEFENVVYGTWAPYRLASISDIHPAFASGYMMNAQDKASYISGSDAFNSSKIRSLVYNDLNNLASVDIVLTNDTSKWTRCPVIEMGTDSTLTEGHVKKFMLRKHASVYRSGLPGDNTVAAEGMGWFPGYAVNLETGERLNMMFGENSTLGQYNGRDMIWNPTPYYSGNGSTYGGMHYVYVFGTSQFRMKDVYNSNVTVTPTRYDKGRWAYDLLNQLSQTRGLSDNSHIDAGERLFASVMWVGMPAPTREIFASGSVNVPISEKNPTLIPTTTTIQIRVRKPYKMNWSDCRASDYANTPALNDNYPMYQFSIESNLATLRGNDSVASSALDNITVVPNPYFAGSLYEGDQIDNRVKITNLPPNCYITIYSVDGTVIRKLRGPSETLISGGGTALTSVDWDLKNERGLQISGGVYLIHIKADGVGEKLVKWFGALRPVDLNSFQ